MTVGYKCRQTESFGTDPEDSLAELKRTNDRLKTVLDVRETELDETRNLLMECVKELCGMCGDDQHPENGTCKTCKWQTVKEWDA